MAYTPTTWTTGDDVTATKLNKIEQGIANTGGYDLVIASTVPVDYGEVQTISNWSIIAGSIENCEEKSENGEPIQALAIVWAGQFSGDAPHNLYYYLPLVYYVAPYQQMYFGGVFNNRSADASIQSAITFAYATFKYNSSTKALTHAHWNLQGLS